MHTPDRERKSLIQLSMSIRCWNELVRYGANEALQRAYGQYLSASPESQYNVTLDIDVEQLPLAGGMSVSRRTNQFN